MSGTGLVWCVLACSPHSHDPPAALVLISVDTLRADAIGSLGGGDDAGTPTLDRWCTGGLAFADCLAHVPLTLPSHGTLLRGVLPPALGIHDNAPFALPPTREDLASRLQEAGWSTAAVVGGQPLSRGCGLERGFDTYSDPDPAEAGSAHFGERRASDVAREAEQVLAKFAPDQPFFLFVHFFDPHFPYTPPPEQIPTQGRFAAEPRRARYQGEVRAVDAALASLEQALRRLDRPVLLVLTADHGEGLGDFGESTHGYQIFDSTLRVPLIFLQVEGARTLVPFDALDNVSKPVQLVDVVPTVLGLFGLEAAADLPGQDLREPLSADRVRYVESFAASLHFHWAQIKGLRTPSGWWLDAGDWSVPDALPLPARLLADGRMWMSSSTDRARPPGTEEISEWSRRWQKLGSVSQDLRSEGQRRALLELGYLAAPTDPGRHAPIALEENRSLPSPLSRTSQIQRVLEAIAALEEGRTARALDELRELRQLEPGNPTILFHLARAWRQRSITEASISAATEAVQVLDALRTIEPSYPGAELQLLQALGLAGRFDAAISLAQDRLESTASAVDHWLLGALLLQTSAGSGRERVSNPLYDRCRGLDHLLRAVEMGRRGSKLVEGLRQTLQRSGDPADVERLVRLERALGETGAR